MSYKNTIQEYCQKNKIVLPYYVTDRIGGNDHAPQWQSTVEIFNKTFKSMGNTKTVAEMNTAKLICDHITKHVNVVETKSTAALPSIAIPTNVSQKCNSIYDIDLTKYNKIVLIDADNCDVMINIEYKNVLFLFFCAKNTSKKVCFELQNKFNNVYVLVSQSVGRDAADHLMTFTAGIISCVNKGKNVVYYVLTKDHYGEYLEKFMTNTKFVCSFGDIVRELV